MSLKRISKELKKRQIIESQGLGKKEEKKAWTHRHSFYLAEKNVCTLEKYSHLSKYLQFCTFDHISFLIISILGEKNIRHTTNSNR